MIKETNRGPDYLKISNKEREIKGEGIRALCRIRCGNMEEDNRYWLKEDKRKCMFCEKGKDNWKHFVSECKITSSWFGGLGSNTEERLRRIWNDKLDVEKESVIIKIGKGKEKIRKKREKGELGNDRK